MTYCINDNEKALLTWIAYRLYDARLHSGARLADVGDFKQWLLERVAEGYIISEDRKEAV